MLATMGEGNEGDVATVQTDLNLIGYENAGVSFAYYMRGKNIGTLKCGISTDNGNNWTNLFTKTGEEHAYAATDPWTIKNIDLSSYDDQEVKVRFQSVRGNLSDNGEEYPVEFSKTPAECYNVCIDTIKFTGDIVSDSEPVTSPTNLVFSNVGLDTIKLTWTKGSGDNSLVIVKEEASILSDPNDAAIYSKFRLVFKR